MIEHDPSELERKRVTSDDTYRLYRAWMRLGEQMISRPLDLAGGTAARIADGLVLGTLGHEGTAQMARSVARDYARLATEMLAVPPSAIGVAVDEFDTVTSPTHDMVERALSGTDPAPSVTAVVVDPSLAESQRRALARDAGFESAGADLSVPDTGPRAPFLLPARVRDASQAWASWFVSRADADRLMSEACNSGHLAEEAIDTLAPVDVGRGGVMVSLVASDYRASDFGVTQEIGLTLTVSPRGTRFPDPGQIFLRLIVTDPYSLATARQIWGIRKDLHDNRTLPPGSRLDVAYGADRVGFGLGAAQALAVSRRDKLQLGFPRFGTGRSDRVPALVYSTTQPHGPPAGPTEACRALLTRSGAGEGMQYGGDVTLSLPADRAAGIAAGCLCAGGMACLCDTLRSLDLHRRKPAANGWTERMTCTLAEPVTVAGQPPGYSVTKDPRIP